MQVVIPVVGRLVRCVLARWGPKWSAGGEVPLAVSEYAEGELEVYGSGRAVVRLRVLPITINVPVRVVGGTVRLSWPESSRKVDVMALRKITQAATPAAGGSSGLADRGQWPLLVEYLTTTAYDDGTARQPSSMVIVADASGWRGCVADKDNDRTLWRTAATLEALLLELEEALAKDDPSSWRQAGGGFKGKRKRS